jgi:biotin carboxylase
MNRSEPAGGWVLLIGGKADVVAKAKALGLRVLLFQDRSRVDDAQIALADHIVLTDLCRPADLIALAHALRPVVPFTAVVSLYEDTLVAAADIRAALDLPGVPAETVRLLKDKSAMRQRLATVGFSPVIATTGETLADVQAFQRRCQGPIVAKPADSSGSFGVFRIVDEATAEVAWEWLAERGLTTRLGRVQ